MKKVSNIPFLYPVIPVIPVVDPVQAIEIRSKWRINIIEPSPVNGTPVVALLRREAKCKNKRLRLVG
jgi:hypothetical protein